MWLEREHDFCGPKIDQASLATTVMSDSEANTTHEVETLLENATELLRDEDFEILSQLNSADGVAQDMEQKLDAVLTDLDRLLARLEPGEPIPGSNEKPKNEIASEEI